MTCGACGNPGCDGKAETKEMAAECPWDAEQTGSGVRGWAYMFLGRPGLFLKPKGFGLRKRGFGGLRTFELLLFIFNAVTLRLFFVYYSENVLRILVELVLIFFFHV